MRVTVDTQVMIWCLRHEATSDQQYRLEEAEAFMAWVEESKSQLVLTNYAVSEYLVGGTPREIAREMETLSERFEIVDFDINAATIAADLYSDKAFAHHLGKDLGLKRPCMKADIAIIATAMAHDIKTIFSEDSGVRAVADRAGLPCREMLSTVKKEETPVPEPPKKQQQRTMLNEEG
ncbi:MAG: PIN domain-containing protein [Planctomycetota bacterium]|nr:PIN domain-containing protein [Planctomycetota bacterium]